MSPSLSGVREVMQSHRPARPVPRAPLASGQDAVVPLPDPQPLSHVHRELWCLKRMPKREADGRVLEQGLGHVRAAPTVAVAMPPSGPGWSPSGPGSGPSGRRWVGQGFPLPDGPEPSIQVTWELPQWLLDPTLTASRFVGISLVFRLWMGRLQGCCP